MYSIYAKIMRLESLTLAIPSPKREDERMSLVIVALFIGELVLWVCANHATPFTTARLSIIQTTTLTAGVLSALYLESWSLLGQTSMLNLSGVWIFMIVNITIWLCITAALIVRWVSNHQIIER
jgi:FtsH-binding integral membrane protein